MKILYAGCFLTGLAVMVMTGCPAGSGDDASPSTPTNTNTVPSAQPTVVTAPVPTVGRAQTDISPELRTSGQVAPEQALPMMRMGDSRLGEMLRVVVNSDGLVRYDLLSHQRWSTILETVVDAYAKVQPPASHNARTAFWCNAYNANVLALVMENRDDGSLRSVQDVSGFFDDKKITVAGETITLDQLENDRLRPLGDPRIHAVLVCAAVSCPPLRSEPYSAADLDDQLNEQAARWVNDPRDNTVENGTPRLSAIFKWYRDDFQIKPYGGILGFVQAFAADGSPLASVPQDTQVEFLKYDWALNQAPIYDDPEK
jgi:hypothetical protein